ncbi:hypothetical protein BDN71DRAFT_1355543, partial [Pleurotus eryngii]
MSREFADTPFDLPSQQEVERWTDDQNAEEAASTGYFKPDLRAPPSSPWNRSHVRVFIRTFLEADTFECVDKSRIRKAFLGHLKALRQKYLHQQSNPREQANRQARANRDERKRNLFHRRLNVARKYPVLHSHQLMLERLGVQGMSSDESDHESGLSQYRILLPKWRNPQLAAWLRVFDAIHRKSRFQSDQTRAGRGARPRLRVVGQTWSTSESYVSQLPLNAYNPNWLARLNIIEKEDVDAQGDEHYDFSHNPDV